MPKQKPLLPRAGNSNYKANLVIAGEETFLCFDDHFEELFNRVVELMLDMAPSRLIAIQMVTFYRWNGADDAGQWAFASRKPMSVFRKRLEELEPTG